MKRFATIYLDLDDEVVARIDALAAGLSEGKVRKVTRGAVLRAMLNARVNNVSTPLDRFFASDEEATTGREPSAKPARKLAKR